MKVLDVIATFAPYAFGLPLLWIAAAYSIAAIRVRRAQPRRQSVSPVAPILNVLFWTVWLIFMANTARNIKESGWMLIWYGYFILFPLLMVNRLKPTSKSIQPWQKFGFASLQDFLLFRPIPDTQSVGDLSNMVKSEQSENRSITWLVVIVSICAAGISYLGDSLQTCEWLDIATGRSGCLRTWPIETGSAYEIAFSPDGSMVAASDFEGPLKVYNILDGKMLYELPDQQAQCGESVSFSADAKLMATISRKGEISIRDTRTWAVQRSFAVNATSIQFSPDGQLFAASIEKSGIQVWRTADWQLQWVIPVGNAMRFTADGRLLAAYTANGTIGLWNMKDGAAHDTVHTDNFRFVLSPDGSQVATTSYGDPLKTWDVKNDSLNRTLEIQSSGDVAYSPDGRYLLVGRQYMQVLSFVYQVGLWRVADGEQVVTLPVYFSSDCVAFASKSNVFGYSDWHSLKVLRLRRD